MKDSCLTVIIGIAIIILLCFIQSCGQDRVHPTGEPEAYEWPRTKLTYEDPLSVRVMERNQYSLSFFKKAYQNWCMRPDKDPHDIFMSPLMCQMICGILGNQMDLMNPVYDELGIGSECNDYLKSLLQDLNGFDGLGLSSAIMEKRTYYGLPGWFLERVQYYYDIDEVDYCPDLPVDNQPCNQWIRSSSFGMVDKVPYSRPQFEDQDYGYYYYLISNVACLGKWNGVFDTVASFEFNKDKGVKIPLNCMLGRGKYLISMEDGVSAITLPLGDGSLSLTVVLPKEGESVSDAIGKMDPVLWKGLRDKVKVTEGSVMLPVFSVTSVYANDIYNLFGDDFKEHYADEACEDEPGTFAYRYLHFRQVFLASSFKMEDVPTMVGSPKNVANYIFKADRPFLYFISETGSGLIIFEGTFSGE